MERSSSLQRILLLRHNRKQRNNHRLHHQEEGEMASTKSFKIDTSQIKTFEEIRNFSGESKSHIIFDDSTREMFSYNKDGSLTEETINAINYSRSSKEILIIRTLPWNSFTQILPLLQVADPNLNFLELTSRYCDGYYSSEIENWVTLSNSHEQELKQWLKLKFNMK